MAVHTANDLALVRAIAGRVNPDRYRETLDALVRIPSPAGEEQEIAEWIASRLQEIGFRDVVVDPLANVLGTVGEGSQRLLLIQHIDTMRPHPGSEQPFTPEYREEGGDTVVYGLGATSTKGTLAAMIEAAAALVDAGLPLPTTTFVGTARDLHPVAHGVRDLYRLHADRLQADGAIIGEPTALRVAVGARGNVQMEFSFKGRPHHAGRPDQAENPVAGAAEFIRRALAESLPRHALLGPATLTPIEISSDGQRPQTPAVARAVLDRRTVPEDPAIPELLERYAELARAGSGPLEVQARILRHQYAWATDPDDPVAAALIAGYRAVLGADPTPYAIPSNSSSAGTIREVGRTTPVAFGATDVEDLGPNEHVSLRCGVMAARVFACAVALF